MSSHLSSHVVLPFPAFGLDGAFSASTCIRPELTRTTIPIHGEPNAHWCGRCQTTTRRCYAISTHGKRHTLQLPVGS